MKLSEYSLTFYLYISIYVSAIALAILLPFEWRYVGLFAINYVVAMFFITAGYHRYFSHRSYRLSRFGQFFFAFMAQSTLQKGVLWWAANHRDHHIHSDSELDLHSPRQSGFWYSHMGWFLDNKTQKYDERKVKDLRQYPEIVWLSKYHWVPAALVGLSVFLIGGAQAFVWGYLLVLVVAYQASYSINSLAHVFGKQRFNTGDDSRNNFWLALLTLGEGWHNNHHYCKSAARQGWKWYEVDITYYILKMLSWVGVVKDMKPFRADNTKNIVVEAQAAEAHAMQK